MKRRTLPLLPGLRWEGKLHVLETRDNNTSVLVQFDAVNKFSTTEPYVYDRSQQFLDWTGEECALGHW